MSQPVDGNSIKTGIADHDLFPADRRGIPFIQRFNIFQQKIPDSGQAFRESFADSFRPAFRFSVLPGAETQRRFQFLLQDPQRVHQQPLIRHLRLFSPKSHGKHQRLQPFHHTDNLTPVRRLAFRLTPVSFSGIPVQGFQNFPDLRHRSLLRFLPFHPNRTGLLYHKPPVICIIKIVNSFSSGKRCGIMRTKQP